MRQQSPSPISHLPSSQRILIRGTNWLGDAVMTTPALLRLREKFPGAHIALLTPEKLADLWKHHPAIDETIPFRRGDNFFTIAGKLRPKNLTWHWCCRTLRDRHWKYSSPASPEGSDTPGPGEIFA